MASSCAGVRCPPGRWWQAESACFLCLPGRDQSQPPRCSNSSWATPHALHAAPPGGHPRQGGAASNRGGLHVAHCDCPLHRRVLPGGRTMQCQHRAAAAACAAGACASPSERVLDRRCTVLGAPPATLSPPRPGPCTTILSHREPVHATVELYTPPPAGLCQGAGPLCGEPAGARLPARGEDDAAAGAVRGAHQHRVWHHGEAALWMGGWDAGQCWGRCDRPAAGNTPQQHSGSSASLQLERAGSWRGCQAAALLLRCRPPSSCPRTTSRARCLSSRCWTCPSPSPPSSRVGGGGWLGGRGAGRRVASLDNALGPHGSMPAGCRCSAARRAQLKPKS